MDIASLFKIATNTHHMTHPLRDDKERYHNWEKRGIITFIVSSILTLGLAGVIMVGTAFAKLQRLKKLKLEDAELLKKVDKSAKESSLIKVDESANKSEQKPKEAQQPKEKEIIPPQDKKPSKISSYAPLIKQSKQFEDEFLTELMQMWNAEESVPKLCADIEKKCADLIEAKEFAKAERYYLSLIKLDDDNLIKLPEAKQALGELYLKIAENVKDRAKAKNRCMRRANRCFQG